MANRLERLAYMAMLCAITVTGCACVLIGAINDKGRYVALGMAFCIIPVLFIKER